MLENLVEKLYEELSTEIKTPTYLELVKRCNMSKEVWEIHKQATLKEIEEVDKYCEEKEKKPILTDEEREYISIIIKPFREKVESIEKVGFRNKEYIRIDLVDDYTALPCFPKGTMYNGLEPDKEYTLEELGVK